jgi:hypothetical protein
MSYNSPKPNTKEEWKEFAITWAQGGWGTLQWYDTSEGADNQWFDFEENEAFYPYDEKLVIRLRDKESIINHLLRLDDTVTRLTLEVAKLQEYNEYVNLSTPKR